MHISPPRALRPPPARPHPALRTARSSLQEFPVQWVGAATLLTPKTGPFRILPRPSEVGSAPTFTNTRAELRGHAGSQRPGWEPRGWGWAEIRIKAKKAEGKWGLLEFETHATCPSHGGC